MGKFYAIDFFVIFTIYEIGFISYCCMMEGLFSPVAW